MDWSESERLRGCDSREGRQEVLADTFVRHQGELSLLVGCQLDRRLRRRVDVSDALQDAYVEASARLEEYIHDLPMAFSMWLRRIVYQTVRDLHRFHLRSGKRSVQKELDRNVESFDSVHPVGVSEHSIEIGLPTEHVMRAEIREQIGRTMKEMKPVDREILLLRYFGGFTSREIAQLLGAEEAAVRKRHLRALRRLRGRLQQFRSSLRALDASLVIDAEIDRPSEGRKVPPF